MKRCVLSLERNIGREDEFRVSGGSEFQRRGPMTEKALLPSDDRTYGMERTRTIIINIKKSVCIRFGRRFQVLCSPVSIGDTILSWSANAKYLGIIFTSGYKLSFDFKLARSKLFRSFNSIYSKIPSRVRVGGDEDQD